LDEIDIFLYGQLYGRIRDDCAPFKQSRRDNVYGFSLEDLMRLFTKVEVLPAHKTVRIDKEILQSYAVELATEVCASNTAEKLVYTIQQLLLKELDQKYEPTIGRPRVQNPMNTTFQDLEPWAVMDSNGTVTVDTDKLQAACDHVREQSYSTYEYEWAKVLLLLYKNCFSKDKQHFVDEVMKCSDIGLTVLLFYLDSSRLTQLAELSSVWEYSTEHELATSSRDIYNLDCAAVIEDNTLILEVARPCLTKDYCEEVRQQLIIQALVLECVGRAVLNKGILPATSVQAYGRLVVDYRPQRCDRPPVLTSKMVPDYQSIQLTVHNMFLEDF
jgi:hypothetical protein